MSGKPINCACSSKKLQRCSCNTLHPNSRSFKKKKKEQLEKSVLRLALELCLVVSNPLDWNIDRLRKCNLELHRQLQGRVSIGQFVTLPLFY